MLALDAPGAAINVEMTLWGPAGLTTPAPRRVDPRMTYTTALNELLDKASTGQEQVAQTVEVQGGQ